MLLMEMMILLNSFWSITGRKWPRSKMVRHSVSRWRLPALGKFKQKDCYEFDANLGYIVSTSLATEGLP